MMKIKSLTTLALLAAGGTTFAADSKFEGSLKPFMGEPKLDIQQVFRGFLGEQCRMLETDTAFLGLTRTERARKILGVERAGQRSAGDS